jgi:hypothetical protein
MTQPLVLCGFIGPGDTCTYAVGHSGTHSWEGSEPVAPPVDLAEQDRLLEDIKERDAQTGPVVPWGSAYDHSRIQHKGYHLDNYEIAMGDRHYLLRLLRAALQAERPTE